MSNRYYITADLTKDAAPNIKNVYYFDNNSTTLIYDKKVKKGIINWISCGNPSNILHDFGKMAHSKIEQCRHTVARDLGVDPGEVFFTSGATESNNIVIQGVLNHHLDSIKTDGGRVTAITSSFEHPSVINIFKHYEDKVDVIYVDPCKDPSDPEYNCVKACDVEKAIQSAKNKVVLISIMHGNNETGAIQDVAKIGAIARKNIIFFHTDITQTIGKYIVKPEKIYADAVTFSGHKFHGPKGVGCLYIKKQCNTIMNLCYGGEQEGHKRPGTENVANIVGMVMALQLVHQDRFNKSQKMSQLREYVISGIKQKEKVEVLGPKNDRSLPNTILLKVNRIGKCNKKLVETLNEMKIYVSVGSACQTESNKGSHVLDTLGLNEADRKKVIRISLSDYTTTEECDYLINHLSQAVDKTIS